MNFNPLANRQPGVRIVVTLCILTAAIFAAYLLAQLIQLSFLQQPEPVEETHQVSESREVEGKVYQVEIYRFSTPPGTCKRRRVNY
ncbi:hypothetical protein [Pontibacter sp. G13]|uniref:hypothetical protein n=1 Tax=Pontibacter sp. G13 TaxID=3074898 RepID=UPI002889B207|nr:hypothetical protein [Pontibacter sp. G13]WNJ20396.1 hypothetical protein RJD25_07935 [Pontibacter sp. G13]